MGRILLVLVGLLLAACASAGGGDATTSIGDEASVTTVAAESPTTTAPAPTTTVSLAPSTTTGAVTGFDDIPEECQVLLREVLSLLEPAAAEIDWSTATIEQHIILMNAIAGGSIESTAGCAEVPDITAEEGAAQVLEFARDEAPGTVAYLEHVMSIPPLEEEIEVTGECQADLATLETIISEGVPMVELPLNKAMVALDLIGTINFCPLQVAGEFTFREETQAFIAGLEHLAGG